MTFDVLPFALSGISNAEVHFQNGSSKVKGASFLRSGAKLGKCIARK
jgi:hypothetical protein